MRCMYICVWMHQCVLTAHVRKHVRYSAAWHCKCLLIWCWKKLFPSLNNLCFSNVSCKQKLQNPSQTQFSLTLLSITYNPIILLIAQASTHTAPSNPSSALSWLHPATFSMERKKGMPGNYGATQKFMPISPGIMWSGHSPVQCSPKSLLVSDHEAYCRPRSMLDSTNRVSWAG